jgi:hypothetical protein
VLDRRRVACEPAACLEECIVDDERHGVGVLQDEL